jgi:Tfp pilus assembly PilM family ATPase
MSTRTTLPLGVDVGAARTRVALVERDADATVRLIAVATAATGTDPARAIANAVAELATRERRCVLALGAPATQLRVVAFPSLSRRERERAARFEAARTIAYPVADAAVRLVPVDATRCVLAIAPQRAIDERAALARAAGLRLVAIDDAALALLRCVRDDTAILDIGAAGSILIVADDPVPRAHVLPVGGATFTEAIARALALDAGAAERRKRTIGPAGAGESTCDGFVAALATALSSARANARSHVRRLALCGNGSRLIGLAAGIEAVLAMPVEPLDLGAAVSTTIPPDVVRAAAPDWALAYGLALWETAA